MTARDCQGSAEYLGDSQAYTEIVRAPQSILETVKLTQRPPEIVRAPQSILETVKLTQRGIL